MLIGKLGGNFLHGFCLSFCPDISQWQTDMEFKLNEPFPRHVAFDQSMYHTQQETVNQDRWHSQYIAQQYSDRMHKYPQTRAFKCEPLLVPSILGKGYSAWTTASGRWIRSGQCPCLLRQTCVSAPAKWGGLLAALSEEHRRCALLRVQIIAMPVSVPLRASPCLSLPVVTYLQVLSTLFPLPQASFQLFLYIWVWLAFKHSL